ncbi:M48 family metalloprotease [Candidatus Gracilibacteria bacterium]|nr:M48 family metalloprotease [Candidatus Gracilibacteria bacterium]
MGLKLVSTITMGILSAFVFVIIFAINMFGEFNGGIWVMIGLIIIFNVLIWLIAPFISDLMYRWFYKASWISIDELAKESPKTSELIKKICEENNIKIPKLGMIADENPTAFTYGSGKWNARIIISHGIVTHLLDEERASVYAHELGHIKNNDFIIMTIASTLLQILYEIYIVFAKNQKSSGGNSKSKDKLAFIGLISYVFYFIGQYILLYLSRVREYFADEFSAKYINPNILSDALIKIAYGILITPANNRLVNSTKFIGIANEKMAKGIGMLYYNVGQDDTNELIEKSFLYDLKNPWASINEFFSTHPLTGKRIGRLMSLTSTPKYDIKAIEEKFPVDREKLYAGFGKDLAILSTTTLLPIIFAIISTIIFYGEVYVFTMLLPSFLIGYGIAILIKTFWAYPNHIEGQNKTTVLELMSDLYASPVKGKSVSLSGTIIGKGDPGYMFSEDVMLKDSTGLMHLDYQSKIPLIGNLIFSLTKVKQFMGQQITTSGWFLRGVSHYTVVDKMHTDDGSIKANGGVKFWGTFMGITFIIIGIGISILLISNG